MADIRRTSIYDGTLDVQTNNNVTISGSLVLDDIVYSQSQEMHWMRIRIQALVTKLWSMCEVRTFVSQGGARTTVWVEWAYVGATFTVPQSWHELVRGERAADAKQQITETRISAESGRKPPLCLVVRMKGCDY